MANERSPSPPSRFPGSAPEAAGTPLHAPVLGETAGAHPQFSDTDSVTAKSPGVKAVIPTEPRSAESNQRTVDELPKGVRPVGRLRVLSGDQKGSVFDVTDSVTLGSSTAEASVVFSSPDLSGAHARIWSTAMGAFHVEDLRSRSGTYVNDIRIQRRALIMGDHIRLGGQLVLEFRF
jgi:pSer/pThr/pTyr-binding forkhead associated (FHA) protein